MIVVPSGTWLVGAAALAAVAPLALVWPAAAGLLPALDLAWLAAFLLDAAPLPRAAHAGDRAARRRSRFSSDGPPWSAIAGATGDAGRLALEARERSPDPLGGAVTPTRKAGAAAGRRARRAGPAHPRSPRAGHRRRDRYPGDRPAGPGLASGDGDAALGRDGVPEPDRRLAPGAAAPGRPPAGGRFPHDPPAGRGPAVRGTQGVGSGRRHPHDRLEGHRPAGQADRAAI